MFRKYIIPLYAKLLIVSYFVGTLLLFKFISGFNSGHWPEESFHLKMGLKYCEADFSIKNELKTSLPGMYSVSTIILRILEFVFGSDTCKVLYLRIVNYLFAVSNVTLFGLIIKEISKQKACYYGVGIYTSWIYTINHAIHPVFYVFTFFYYPDPMSVFTVFLMYYLYLKGFHTVAALTGAIAIMVYHMNVVWVGFLSMIQFMTAMMFKMRKWKKCRRIMDAGKHVPIMNVCITYITITYTFLAVHFSYVLDNLFQLTVFLFQILVRYTVHVFTTWDKLVICCFSYNRYLFVTLHLCIIVAIVASHSFVIHIPQLLYFCLFYIIFSPCSVILSIPKFLRCTLSAKKQTTFIVVSLAIIIYFNTLIYPYTLSNDSFYEFYVWKDLFERKVMLRYLFIPFYMLGGYAILEKLKDEKTPFILAYFIAIVLLLVTQKIFQFRYYLLPYFFITINSTKRNVTEVFIENIYYILINTVVVISLYRQEIVWIQSTI